MENQKFEQWAILELFGHNTLAGLVTERTLAGAAFIQVDVPETPTQIAFTRLLNPTAIYAINPVDEQTARTMADKIRARPVQAWEISQQVEKSVQLELDKREKLAQLPEAQQENQDSDDGGPWDAEEREWDGKLPGEEEDL